ncbi:MAG: dihydropteroate synthase [Acidobacteria bacterium]|nr:dihydropteroate synthase [Acidobacteriota bacterium]
MNLRPNFDISVHGRTVRLGERTLVMGVLNVTPDSFSDGGRYLAPDRAIAHGLEMARQGADWIDVGGESARPGALPVSTGEELRRVLPVIRGLRRKSRSLVISIDTTKAEVADRAVRAGANVINDVSGLRFDPRVADVARRHRTPLILMHLRGRPETMQQKPFVRSVWRAVGNGLAWSIRRALASGVRRSQLIIDPGMGFGKSRRQNYEILAGLRRLQSFRLPILVGTSRKSFVQAVVAGEGLDQPSREKSGARLWPLTEGRGALRTPAGGQSPPLQIGDAAMVAATVLGGAHIVRVHDVAAALPAVRIADAILAARR